MAGIVADKQNINGDPVATSGQPDDRRRLSVIVSGRRLSIAFVHNVPWWRHFVGIALAIAASLVDISSGEQSLIPAWP